ncbi:hypothetical protein SCMU_14480 [Sinomonas cyclohexanicum]|uniref:Uncharacterized protein n=1 Tax=Sinomonas cyclohexanicum TaxID=322009 RepID=A0ABM7PTP7_SINCY|nr:hypothetical protein SCMU_14480 [Corynebacterium cyclohexanicum]
MTAVAEDLDLLTRAEDARRCEHEEHATDTAWHADGGELFVRYVCPWCGPSVVHVRCGRWVQSVNTSAVLIQCRECKVVSERGWYVSLGPANDGGGVS